jgi:hypothetical protein
MDNLFLNRMITPEADKIRGKESIRFFEDLKEKFPVGSIDKKR